MAAGPFPIRYDERITGGISEAHGRSARETKPSRAMFDLLFLTHRVPFPPDKGDRIRTYHILRFLAGRARVHLACLADEPAPAAAHAELRSYCERVAVIPLGASRWWHGLSSLIRGRTVTEGAFHIPALNRIVTDWCATTRFSAVLASASSHVPYLRLPALRGVPAVVDLMDVDSQKWLDFAAVTRGPRSWLYRAEGHRLRQLEAGLPGEFRAVTFVSAAEAALYRQFCAGGGSKWSRTSRFTISAVLVGNAIQLRLWGRSIIARTWTESIVLPDRMAGNHAGLLRELHSRRRPVRAAHQFGQFTGSWSLERCRRMTIRACGGRHRSVTARGLQNKVLEAMAMVSNGRRHRLAA